MTTQSLPPLQPLFERLAAVHPWWTCKPKASYGSWYEWAYDGSSCRDADWMRGHLVLLDQINCTRMGLGWSHHDTGGTGPIFRPRTYFIQRGTGHYDDFERHGDPISATGPTDLHAYLEALVLALEAEIAEGREIKITEPEWQNWWLDKARSV